MEPIDYQERLAQALTAMRKLRARTEALERERAEPIAIIGIGCRFPGGADSADAFWALLRDGRDAIAEVPRDRWNIDDVYDPDPDAPGKMYVRQAGFLEQVDRFDPHFFGILPREAPGMDPQQRMLLEIVWEAFEHAGIAAEGLVGSATGVFVGITATDYQQLIARSIEPSAIEAHLASGTPLNVAAGRISFLLGLQGPSLAVDTACSSSLTALHLACQSLRARETTMALAAGVNVILSPETFIAFSRWKMLAPDGRCKTFDARADGFGRGEGCGVVVLKRLGDALAAGDRVFAVIRGTAANQDGRSSGLSVPNGQAQEAVIRQALANAGVTANDIDYVEAHGTGTSLGDPIEVEALALALCRARPADCPLQIGSVKTNVGHLESASGVAGLIKVVLALMHEELPPHLHLQRRNPQLVWEKLAIEIPTTRRPWRRGARRRLAGVSSFGFSGTNVHVVVEEAPAAAAAPAGPERPVHLLALSARNLESLGELASRYDQFLGGVDACEFADVCFTAGTGRNQFSERLAIVAATPVEARQKLSAARESLPLRGRRTPGRRPRIAWLFTGQGAQFGNMGRDLYHTQPAFRRALDACFELLAPKLPRRLDSVLFTEDPALSALLDETAFTQPALFAFEYAMAQLWRSWGVEPDVVLGHSVGEYVAACVAGVFSLEHALGAIAERARLMQALPRGGAMAAIFAPRPTVEAALRGIPELSIAAFNAPEHVVVSGDAGALEQLLARLGDAGVKSRRLAVSHAFHSALLEPMLDPFEEALRACDFRPARIPLVSNVTGAVFGVSEIADPAYWRRHARQPVQFEAGIRAACDQGIDTFVEIGPAPVLLGMARQCVPDHQALWLPSMKRGRPEWQSLLEAAAALFEAGARIDFGGVDAGFSRRRVTVPGTAFQRQRYWIPSGRRSEPTSAPARDVHPLLGRRLHTAGTDVIYESSVGVARQPFLADHRVRGTVLVPATAYVEMGLAAVADCLRATNGNVLAVEDLAIHQALALRDEDVATVQVLLTVDGTNQGLFRIFSASADQTASQDGWHLHASGRVRIDASGANGPKDRIGAMEPGQGEEVSPSALYERFAARHVAFGPAFAAVERLWRHEHEATAIVGTPPSVAAEADGYKIHPATLDACLHLLGSCLPGDALETYLPVSFDSVRLFARPVGQLRSRGSVRPHDGTNPDMLTADVQILDERGVAIEVHGFHLRRTPIAVLDRATRPQSLRSAGHGYYQVQWREQQAPAAANAATAGNWVVLADRGGFAARLATRLRERGAECVLIYAGEERRRLSAGEWTIDPKRLDDLHGVLVDDGFANRALARAIDCWSLDQPDASAGPQREAILCGGGLQLVRSLGRTVQARPPRLWFVTRGAQSVRQGDPSDPEAALLFGLGRIVDVEHQELRCTRIDLDPSREPDVTALVRELTCDGDEREIALRADSRYVARLARHRPASAAASPDGAASGPVRLEIDRRGSLDALVCRPCARRVPGGGEVEIQVAASGLNFRDVLNALGMYPGDAGPLGGECAGTIVSVGDGVSGLGVGDAVMGLAAGSLASHVTTSAALVVRKPAALSFEEAATIPSAFLTAHYALNQLGRLARGERVLIHAAAGGVGLAAVHLARRVGAEVFATAGSEEKRAFLRSLGVRYVMSSRTLDFADEILQATSGAGVDLVVNSLTGGFIEKSLSALRRGGRFIELSKIGVWSTEDVDRACPGASYHVVDLSETCRTDPEAARAMLATIADWVERGEVRPLPHRTFALAEAESAFRYMAQAKHLGKIVVSVQPVGTARGAASISADASYLITGGLAGLGLLTAQWLADRGARHVILMGRGAPSAEATLAIERLQDRGVRVAVVRGDVSSASDVAAAVSLAGAGWPPLRGVFHSAGVLDDGALLTQEWPKFERVLAPKVSGTWNLHAATRHKPLDFFVLYSSAVALFGSPGLANHAAACAYEDAFAHWRRASGLPAVSISWGPWAEIGTVARLQAGDRFRSQGALAISTEEGLKALEYAVFGQVPQLAVVDINWQALAHQSGPVQVPPLLSELVSSSAALDTKRTAAVEGAPLLDRLRDALPRERRRLLQEYVRDQVVTVLGLEPTYPLDPQQGLREFGIDSLVSIELKNRLQTAVDQPLPTTLVFDHPTIAALVEFLEGTLFKEAAVPPRPPAASAEDSTAEALAELEVLSHDEAEALLLDELAKARGQIS